jgi:hypothetical protein
MTHFQKLLLPSNGDVTKIEQALDHAFQRYSLTVPRCDLIGSTEVEVIVHPEGRPEFRFHVFFEDIVTRNLAARIDTALRAALGNPPADVM